MKSLFFIAAVLVSTISYAEIKEVKVGEPAPIFAEKDQAGAMQRLEMNKGKWVVLEWYNEDCPYVKKHYGSGNMQSLQKKYTEKGVVWYTIATSAQDKEGYIDPKMAEQKRKAASMNSTALLLDSDGTMGRAYAAKTTPHMFVINPEGKVVYAGAIDDNSSSDPKKIPTSKNYVAAALDEGMGGKPVTMASTKPYGCSVKY